MTHAEISDKIIEKLKEVVKNQNEYKMIIDLLETEKHYVYTTDRSSFKREFQNKLAQYFPLDEQNE